MIERVGGLSPSQIDRLRLLRWKARTDLVWFCNNVLGFPDVTKKLHGPLIDLLQHFPKPTEAQVVENDQYINGKWVYKPLQPDLMRLEGLRRLLILDSRGLLKSTINCDAHTIQWIINYPDISVAILQANIAKAEKVIFSIKNHFTRNPIFRELFPEHCPPAKKANDWGTAAEFTSEARSRTCTRKESTVIGASIEKGLAGSHFDIIKYSDIVDETNCLTEQSNRTIFDKFVLSQNLLVSPRYWIDVEGTRYDEQDTYGRILASERVQTKRTWKTFVRGVFEKDTKGKPRTYTEEELDLPDLLDADGNPISIWPERHPVEGIMSEFVLSPYVTSCQKFNKPNRAIGGQTIFPTKKDGELELPLHTISRRAFKENVWISHWEITVDTAETDYTRSNCSVISVGAWDQAGRLYVVDIKRGKWLAAELIVRLIAVWQQTKLLTKNGYVRVRIEETGYVRGLMFGLQQYLQQRQLYMDVQPFKINNQKSKAENITNTLQLPYKTGNMIFLDDLTEMGNLLAELKKFPAGATDDILDTLAAFYKDKEWLGRNQQRPETQPLNLPINVDLETRRRQKAFEIALGFQPDFENQSGGPAYDPNHALTGGL